jgi:phage tail P2-like protein
MTVEKTSWAAGRPVFKRLPYLGYQDNKLVDALTTWVDDRLTDKYTRSRDFWQLLQPSTATADSLDYAAYLMGFSEALWVPTWAESLKRSILQDANYLLRNRGNILAILRLLSLMGLSVTAWTGRSLLIPFNIPGTFGTSSARIFLRAPLSVPRSSDEWVKAEYIRQHWVSAPIKSAVCYERFYVGYSRIGEPMF